MIYWKILVSQKRFRSSFNPELCVSFRLQWRIIAYQKLLLNNVLHLILSNVFPTSLTAHTRDHNVVIFQPLKLMADFPRKIKLKSTITVCQYLAVVEFQEFTVPVGDALKWTRFFGDNLIIASIDLVKRSFNFVGRLVWSWELKTFIFVLRLSDVLFSRHQSMSWCFWKDVTALWREMNVSRSLDLGCCFNRWWKSDKPCIATRNPGKLCFRVEGMWWHYRSRKHLHHQF